MSKLNKSWERIRDDIHSPAGIEELKKNIKSGLIKKYSGLFENMFSYEFDSDMFEDMRVMSRDTVPEKFLFKNGRTTFFKDDRTNQIHCLPFVENASGINIYGQINEWSPVPVGYTDDKRGTYSAEIERIRNMKLTPENAVIMKNDIFGYGDAAFVESMVNELVDNILTMNQLQLLAAYPFVFNVSDDNILTAKNFFLAVAEHKPAIFTNSNGEKVLPVVEKIEAKIDPALFELFDRFECQILEYAGFPCVPITKRAQQTVSEVESNSEKIRMRREDRFYQRKVACQRIYDMWGARIIVHSLIDEWIDEQDKGEEQKEVSEDE